MNREAAMPVEELVEELAPQRRFRPYPEYRESAEPWNGLVPAHWRTQPLKRFSWLSAGAGFPDDEQGNTAEELPFFKVGDMATPCNRIFMRECGNTVSRKTARRLRAMVFASGTIVFAKVGAALLLNRRRILCRPSCLDNNMMGLTLTEGDTGWFFYRLCDLDFARLANPGAVPSLNERQVREIVVAAPPLDEQRAIAAFLDRETARIDELIAKKRRLIELLAEKRTALISHAVTKGLNPNVKMKDSGVEWLGDIPQKWYTIKFMRAAFFQEGPGLRNWQFTNSGIRVICVTNITDSGIDFSSYEKFISCDEYESSYRHFTVSSGDLLLSSSGNSWGKVAAFLSDETVILNTSTIRINQNDARTLSLDLIKWCLQSESTREQLGLMMTGSCQPNFGPSHLSRAIVPVPPKHEQQEITAFIGREATKLEALVDEVAHAIERLQEYRSALISAAVTGKIDVRREA